PGAAIYDNTAVPFTLTAVDGVHYLAAEYRDPSANWCCAGLAAPNVNQALVSTSVILDTTAPTVTFVSANPAIAGVGPTATITVQVFDATSGIAATPVVTVTQNGGTSQPTTFVSCAPALPQTNVTVTCTYTYPVITGQDG